MPVTSVAVMKYHEPEQFIEEFVLAYGSGGLDFHKSGEGVAAGVGS